MTQPNEQCCRACFCNKSHGSGSANGHCEIPSCPCHSEVKVDAPLEAEWEKEFDATDFKVDSGCDEPCCGGCTSSVSERKVTDFIRKVVSQTRKEARELAEAEAMYEKAEMLAAIQKPLNDYMHHKPETAPDVLLAINAEIVEQAKKLPSKLEDKK